MNKVTAALNRRASSLLSSLVPLLARRSRPLFMHAQSKKYASSRPARWACRSRTPSSSTTCASTIYSSACAVSTPSSADSDYFPTLAPSARPSRLPPSAATSRRTARLPP